MRRNTCFLAAVLLCVSLLGGCRKMPVVTPTDATTQTTMPLTQTTVSATTIPTMTVFATTVPTKTPAAAVPITTVPAATVPATTIPATTVPAITVPATTIPATTVPAITVPATTIPATIVPTIATLATTVPATTIPATAIPTTVPPTTVPATIPPTTAPTIPVSQASFEAKQFAVSDGVIRYWLYVPVNATKDMPLVVYLHGGSGKGNDLTAITAVDGLPQYLQNGCVAPGAYVLIPQLATGYKGWSDMKADLMKLITAVKNEYAVDANRISLTGHSMGGTGTWQIALAYPNTFSAVAPLSGSVKLTDVNIQKLKNLPLWAMVGDSDTIVDPQSSIDFVNALSGVNTKANMTILEGADHFAVPAVAYLQTDLLPWLISQSK